MMLSFDGPAVRSLLLQLQHDSRAVHDTADRHAVQGTCALCESMGVLVKPPQLCERQTSVSPDRNACWGLTPQQSRCRLAATGASRRATSRWSRGSSSSVRPVA